MSVESLRPLVQKHAGSIPVDFLLAWIDHESSGRVGAVSKIGERGMFQIHPEGERQQLGLDDEAWDRLLTDRDFAIRTGVRLVKHYAQRAAKLLQGHRVDWGQGRSFWTLVKLFHAATAMPKFSFAAFLRDKGRPPRSFDELKAFVLDEKPRLAEDKAFHARLTALAVKVFPNSEKVGRVVPESFLALMLGLVHPYLPA